MLNSVVYGRHSMNNGSQVIAMYNTMRRPLPRCGGPFNQILVGRYCLEHVFGESAAFYLPPVKPSRDGLCGQLPVLSVGPAGTEAAAPSPPQRAHQKTA